MDASSSCLMRAGLDAVRSWGRCGENASASAAPRSSESAVFVTKSKAKDDRRFHGSLVGRSAIP